MGRIQRIGNELKISFSYSPEIIGAIKEIPGRRYEVSQKCWYVPIRFFNQCCDALQSFGFIFDKSTENLFNKPRITELKTQLPLYGFQREGVFFLLNTERALLASDPGTGKTIQALAAIEQLKAEKVLVVVMKSLLWNFASEILKWYPKAKVIVINGKNQQERLKQYQQDAQLYVLGYETMRNDIGLLEHTLFSVIIFDEAHRLGNPQTQLHKAAKQLKADKIWCTTGTPMQNTPQDYFGIYDILLPGLLGTIWSFRQKFTNLDYFGHVESYKNLDVLRKIISPYMLRHAKRDVIKELPERITEDIIFELSPLERRIYNSVKKEILAYVKHIELSKVSWGTLSNTLVKLLRLREITGHLLLVGDKNVSSKMDTLEDLLESLDGKVIIFTQFKRLIKIINDRFKNKYNIWIISGDVDAPGRQKAVENFNNAEKGILLSTDAGAYGLNITTAEYIIMYDLPFSISRFEQRCGRAERIGNINKQIVIYNLLAKDTIDFFVQGVLEKKFQTADDMMKGIKMNLI